MGPTIKTLLLLLAGLATLAVPAAAQDNYPTRNIRLLVSFPPGGGIDATSAKSAGIRAGCRDRARTA